MPNNINKIIFGYMDYCVTWLIIALQNLKNYGFDNLIQL